MMVTGGGDAVEPELAEQRKSAWISTLGSLHAVVRGTDRYRPSLWRKWLRQPGFVTGPIPGT